MVEETFKVSKELIPTEEKLEEYAMWVQYKHDWDGYTYENGNLTHWNITFFKAEHRAGWLDNA
jgi:hypothetical protein